MWRQDKSYPGKNSMQHKQDLFLWFHHKTKSTWTSLQGFVFIAQKGTLLLQGHYHIATLL